MRKLFRDATMYQANISALTVVENPETRLQLVQKY